MIRRAGGIPKPVRLTPPEWKLDLDALAAAFSDRTKLIVLNNPQNPASKVFSRAELDAIAELVKSHNAYAVCDAVYAHLVFDWRAHIPLMTLPGMPDLFVRLGPAGQPVPQTGSRCASLDSPRHPQFTTSKIRRA